MLFNDLLKLKNWSTAILLIAVAGCGSETVSVTGTATYDGKPVTEGELQFVPAATGGTAHKASAATIQPDGTFTLRTMGIDDGAYGGPHEVSYTAPPPRPQNETVSQSSGEPSKPEKPVPSAFQGLVPEQKTVEIPAGGGEITVNLVKP